MESPLRAYLEGLLSEVVATAKRGDDQAIEWLRRFPELPAFGESVAAAARRWERAHSIAELSDSDDSGEDSDEDEDGNQTRCNDPCGNDQICHLCMTTNGRGFDC